MQILTSVLIVKISSFSRLDSERERERERVVGVINKINLLICIAKVAMKNLRYLFASLKARQFGVRMAQIWLKKVG